MSDSGTNRLLSDYLQHGFVFIPGLVKSYVPAIEQMLERDPTFRMMAAGQGRYEQPRLQIALLGNLCRFESILAACESSLGTGACLLKDKLICKPPGATGYEPHRDMDFGWCRFVTSALTVVVPLDP